LMHRSTACAAPLICSLGISLFVTAALAGPADGENQSAVKLGFGFKPGDTTYYIIENEYRDSAAIPPLLSYTSILREKRYITQTTEAVPTSNKSEADSDLVKVTWTCTRYEVREKGFGPEATYDSIRDLYPPSPLRELAGIPGSTVRFMLNPATGITTKHEIAVGNVASPGGRAGGSRTADHCSLTVENIKRLLDDMGPYYLSNESHKIGDRWTKSHVQANANFGDVTTKLTCEIKGVGMRGANKVASIVLNGEQSFVPKKLSTPTPPPRPVTSRPATSGPATSRPAPPERVNKLDKAVCSGTLAFDLTRGRLLELVLRRETGFLTEMKGQDDKITNVRMSGAQNLRVTSSDTPPPMPKIMGGLKPPIEPDQPKKSAGKAPPAKRMGKESTGKMITSPPADAKTTSQPSHKVAPMGITPGPAKK
jgi:hypothetical protein